MKQKKLTIISKVSERDLIEACLNYYHSGFDYKPLLVFHALANSWKSDKIIYYLNLILEEEADYVA